MESSKKTSAPWTSDKVIWAFWAVIFGTLLIAIALLFRMSTHVEEIEAKLSYRPPTQTGEVTQLVASKPEEKVYVPIYSHVYAHGGKPILLEVTLSIRNTDIDVPMLVNEVNYYDTDGNQVRRYIDAPIEIAPLATVEFLVAQQDYEGGSGANFVVSWTSEQPVNDPLIEAVMVGSGENDTVSFVSTSVPIENK